MKTKKIICSLLTIGLLAGFTAAASAKENDEAKLEAQAKISKADAEKTALAKVPGGTVKEGEVENENGKLVWSFDISTPDTKDITEVQVDANSSEVVSVAKESAEDQAKAEVEDKEQKGEHKDKEDKD